MTWDYSGDPLSSEKDWVRHKIRDTDECAPEFSDEEILAELSENGNKLVAAAKLLRVLAIKYSKMATMRVGDVSKNCSDIAKAYKERADELDKEISILAIPSFGGLSKDEKRQLDQDEDAVQPSFRIGMDDDPSRRNERDGYWDDRWPYED